MKIRLREHMSWETMQIAVEMARLLGFGSETATFPVTSFVFGEEVPKTLAGLEAYQPLLPATKAPADYCASSKDARTEVDFDWRQKKGLETLFSRGSLLKDCNLDGLPDKMDFVIVLPRDASIYMLAAACDLAFRFGMETTAYDGLLLTDHEPKGNAVVFADSTACSINWEENEAGTYVVITGNGPELQELVSQFCQTFPMLDSFHTWREYLQDAIDSFTMRNLDGQMSFAAAYGHSGDLLYGSPADENELSAVGQALPDIQYKNHKDGKIIYGKSYAPSWEADVFRDALSRACQDLHPGDDVEIYAALSESKEVRHSLAENAEAMILAAGAKPKKVQLLCAYKQGYTWLEEIILPKLANMNVSSIQISFKPFLPEGATEWQDEDGAVPSYTNTGKNPDHWYDLPIRFLQELYPIEDRLAQGLGISREKITFTKYDGDEDITYYVSAVDDTGCVLLTDSYRVRWSERPYLDEYPDMGKVHPDTGYLQVVVNGICCFEQRIPTDLEAIWDIFQADILPDCRQFVENKTSDKPTAELQPFFSRLKIEVYASEPEYQLQSREDLFSTLDGLHEDIYFAATDYFKKYGLKQTGSAFDAPGLILPVIHVRDSMAPTIFVELADLQADAPQLCRGETVIAEAGSRHKVQAYVSSVTHGGKGLRVCIEVEGAAPEVVRAYTAFLQQGLLDASKQLAGIEQIVFIVGDFSFTATVSTQENIVKDLSIENIDIPQTEVIGYERYLEIIGQLRRVSGLQVCEVARSYAGRRIYAVEVIPEHDGYLSRTKRLTRYPSVYINARHHANEVSSTNATLLLIKKLLIEETNLAQRLNLIILPMENVDGTAIHYSLQRDNPNWKLHVARFNHLGNEFAHEYFHTDTIHTEAMAFTRIFERFLPDIVVDDHGVPSHEWDQQFSGYTSPAYKGFWLPRSLLYGYFWYITEDSYRSNYALNKKLEDAIANAVGADEEMVAWNNEWAARFEKYAHGWLPKLFPADYYKGMINYWIGYPYRPWFYYVAYSFPWITSISYTSEVADETAQGDYLALCAKTHLTHDLATLKLFASARCIYEQSWQIGDDGIQVKCIRSRPVIAEEA